MIIFLRLFLFTSSKFTVTGWLLLSLIGPASCLSNMPVIPASSISILPPQRRRVVVVGGGPVGLAAALTLARPPHNCQVTVLEQQVGNGQAMYDPTRSYLYNINRRGLLWFDRLIANNQSTAYQKLMERGSASVPGSMTMVDVPADPNLPIPPVTRIRLGQNNNATTTTNVARKSRPSVWIPRHQMVQMLQEECQALSPSIEILHGKAVERLSAKTEQRANNNMNIDDSVTVHCTDGSSYTASLIIGADGYNSTVRTCLANMGPDDHGGWFYRNGLTGRPRFRVKRYQSPATGLKLKALQFPPNFTIPNGPNDPPLQTQSESIYVLRGKYKDSKRYLSIGFLPVKDPTLVRPGNTNTRPDHAIWSIRTGPEMKAWFQDAFPRMPWNDLISDPEWERFAQATGTSFPYCQYSPHSVVSSDTAGVVLVGDACHAFPPDIGQGINAGLQDVVALDQVLQGQTIDTAIRDDDDADTEVKSTSKSAAITLAQALEYYQDNRGREHAALIRLARFGAPYQYRQPWLRDRIGKFFWTVNVAIRLLLNKIFKTPPAAILLTSERPDLTYRQVMQRADLMTWALQSTCLAMALWLLSRFQWW